MKAKAGCPVEQEEEGGEEEITGRIRITRIPRSA
jgi:hypothetical protein